MHCEQRVEKDTRRGRSCGEHQQHVAQRDERGRWNFAGKISREVTGRLGLRISKQGSELVKKKNDFFLTL